MKFFKIHLLFLLIFFITGLAYGGNITGKIEAIGLKHSGDAVIYVEKAPGNFSPAQKHAQMDQKNLVFVPHVLPIVAGTTVDFLNSDEILHNIFSPDKCAEKFNLGTYPKGAVRSYTFKNTPCAATILCNVHPEMAAYIVVLQNPYFSVSTKDGKYKITDIPAGTYTLKVWHEKLKPATKEITVSASGDLEANFQLKR